MFYPQNLHTHTTFADGKDDCESIVVKALEIGFTGIGFSEHAHMSYGADPTVMTADKAEAYKAEVARVKKKYEGQIEVFCGLEFDQYSNTDLSGYDYVLDSSGKTTNNQSAVLLFPSSHDITKEVINNLNRRATDKK